MTNIFNRFESRQQQAERQAAEARLRAIREEYGLYCKSRFMTVEQAWLDFEELIRHPMVQCVDFADIDGYRFFLIGTTHVSIKTHSGERYNIGEFIIMIHRAIHKEVSLAPTLLVENVTKPNGITGGPRGRKYKTAEEDVCFELFAHPHVNGNPGEFCMQAGKEELNVALVEGNLLEAFHFIISALQSAGPNYEYIDIWKWPMAGKE